MRRFDVLVVGAGPGGSSAAYRLARAHAAVLMVDRALFPRNKPCGGGVTFRAVRELPVPIDAVVEATVDQFEFGLRYGRRFERRSSAPLCVMTQRRRLDAHLVEQAAEAGVEVSDGVRVSSVQMEHNGVSARIGRGTLRASALIVADGVNGTTAKAARIGGNLTYAVALEGNVSFAHAHERLRRRIVIEAAAVPGGYAWIFPKGDHLNVGVGGWASEAPRLRRHLARLCREYDIDPARVEDATGYRLPFRDRHTVVARGRAIAVGDAAGLVDPLSGDGIYEAAASARLGVDAVLKLVRGQASGLEAYASALSRELDPLASASWAAKHALDRFPRMTFTVMRSGLLWPAIEEFLAGETSDPRQTSRWSRLPLATLRLLGAARSSKRANRPQANVA